MTHLDDFLRGYATAILWANAYGPDGEPAEDMTYAYHSPGNWWESIGMGLDDAKAFFETNMSDMLATGEDNFAQHGHDFALTRNGHGAGFWDRGYGAVGDTLSDAARVYGEHSVIADDGPTVTNF